MPEDKDKQKHNNKASTGEEAEEKKYAGEESTDNGKNEAEADLELKLSREELFSLCRESICGECEFLQEQKDLALRAMADAENFKKRMVREKEEHTKYAVASFIEQALPVIDNLELALEHGRKNEACKDLVQGVEMTLNMFHQVLGRNNLRQVGREGEPFDPVYHEAMAQQEREDMEEGTVCHVMQKGYLLGDRLVRPAKVLVSRKCPPEKNE